MKENIFMRVLFCKIHCPFMCFCKPTSAASGPLKLEQAAPCRVVSVPDIFDQFSDETAPVKEETKEKRDDVLRSCVKKPSTIPRVPDNLKEVEKKRVKWIDELGQELAEIKEFESCETGENDMEDETRGCVCIIL